MALISAINTKHTQIVIKIQCYIFSPNLLQIYFSISEGIEPPCVKISLDGFEPENISIMEGQVSGF